MLCTAIGDILQFLNWYVQTTKPTMTREIPKLFTPYAKHILTKFICKYTLCNVYVGCGGTDG